MLNAVINFNVGIEHFKEDLVIDLFGRIFAEVLVNPLDEVVLNGYFSRLGIRRVDGNLLFGIFPDVIEPGADLLEVIIRFVAGFSGIQLHIGRGLQTKSGIRQVAAAGQIETMIEWIPIGENVCLGVAERFRDCTDMDGIPPEERLSVLGILVQRGSGLNV